MPTWDVARSRSPGGRADMTRLVLRLALAACVVWLSGCGANEGREETLEEGEWLVRSSPPGLGPPVARTGPRSVCGAPPSARQT